MSIAENIVRIRNGMNAAAIAAGRNPEDILLCAATKMNGADAVRQAIAGGVDCCGENRVQELTAKLAEDAYRGAPVHFIGHLQTNKERGMGLVPPPQPCPPPKDKLRKADHSVLKSAKFSQGQPSDSP